MSNRHIPGPWHVKPSTRNGKPVMDSFELHDAIGDRGRSMSSESLQDLADKLNEWESFRQSSKGEAPTPARIMAISDHIYSLGCYSQAAELDRLAIALEKAEQERTEACKALGDCARVLLFLSQATTEYSEYWDEGGEGYEVFRKAGTLAARLNPDWQLQLTKDRARAGGPHS